MKMNSKPETILKLDCMFIDDEELCYLSSESSNVALLDCGAAKTVMGRRWFEMYEDSLHEEEKSQLKEEHNISHFKFVRDSAQLKICILVSNQLIFGSCIVEATKVVPNNKVSEFQH